MPVPLTSNVVHLNWNLTANEILALSKDIIAKSKQLQDDIAALPVEKQTFENVILPLARSEGELFTLSER